MTNKKRGRTDIISVNPILVHFQPQNVPCDIIFFYQNSLINLHTDMPASILFLSLFFVLSWDKKNEISNYFCKIQCKRNFLTKSYVVLQNILFENWHVFPFIFCFKFCFSFDIFYPGVLVRKLFFSLKVNYLIFWDCNKFLTKSGSNKCLYLYSDIHISKIYYSYINTYIGVHVCLYLYIINFSVILYMLSLL